MSLRFSTLSTRSFFMLLLAVAAGGLGFLSAPASVQAQRGGGSSGSRGGSQVEFRNDSSRPVKLMHWDRARSSWDSHGTVNPRTTSYQNADIGDRWAFVDPRTNQVISSLSVGRFARQLTITNADFSGRPGAGDRPGGGHGGGQGDHGHGSRPAPVLLEVHASNRSSQTLHLYRDGGSGALQYVESLAAGREVKVKTPPNTLWALVLPNGNRVVAQTRITSTHNDLEVYDRDLGVRRPTTRPVPQPSARTVDVTFVNLSAERLAIYRKERRGNGRHEATIQPRQQQRLSLPSGDQYVVLRSSDQQLVQTLQVPNRSITVTLSQQQVRSGGGGHGHSQGGGSGSSSHNSGDQGRPSAIGPREFFRNMFRR